MPRNYTKKKEVKYSSDNMEKAIKLVTEDGKTIYAAAKECSVPKETLRRRIKNSNLDANKREGRYRVLSAEEESMIVAAAQYSQKSGIPLDSNDICELVAKFCVTMNKKTPFKDGVPGEDWMLAFKKRNQEQLRLRKPEVLTLSRAKCLNQEVVDNFFSMLSNLITSQNIVPSSIYNLDETGLSTNHLSKKVFVNPKSKDAYQLAASCGKAMYSVLFCVSAEGKFLPPFVVFKGEGYLYTKWIQNGPPGCSFGATPSGWMQDYLFENW